MTDLPKNNGGSDEAGEATLVGGAAHHDLRRQYVISPQDLSSAKDDAMAKVSGEWLRSATAGAQPGSDASPRSVVPLDSSSIADLLRESQGKLDEMFSKTLLEKGGAALLNDLEAVMREEGETTRRRIGTIEEDQRKILGELRMGAFFMLPQSAQELASGLWAAVGAADAQV